MNISFDPITKQWSIHGSYNPVTVARQWFRAMEMDIDEESFIRVERLVGERNTDEPGFFVVSIEDVQKLCEIGDFVIFCRDGVLVAEMIDGRLRVVH